MPTRRRFLSAIASLAAAAGLSRLAGGAAKAAEPVLRSNPGAAGMPQPGDAHPAPHLSIRCWHTNTAEYQPDGTYKVRVHYEAVDERGNVTPMGSKLLPEA